MKIKKFTALALAFVMALGMAISANAESIVWYYNHHKHEVDVKFAKYLTIPMDVHQTRADWNAYTKIYRDEHADMHGYNPTESAYEFWGAGVPYNEYHDGLILVEEKDESGETSTCYYMDEKGNTVDLNRGRYKWMSNFSDGLAAVAVEETEGGRFDKIGYIDTSGNEVIAPNAEWSSITNTNGYDVFPPAGGWTVNSFKWEYTHGSTYVGSFKDGRAVVVRYESNEHPYICMGEDVGVYYNYIDTSGNYVGDWTYTEDYNEIYMLPLYNNFNTWLGDTWPVNPAAWHVPSIQWSEQEGNVIPIDAAFSYHPKEFRDPQPTTVPKTQTEPELPEYNQDAPSLFGSTAKIAKFYLADGDVGEVFVDITNPNDVTDAGVVAVVLVNTSGSSNYEAVCGFIPYELGAGETRGYNLIMSGVFDITMFDSPMCSYAETIDSHVSSAIITFSDDADMHAFFDTIPYEKNWRYHMTWGEETPRICDGKPGTEWLKTLGMPRLNPWNRIIWYPYVDASKVDHDDCAK